MDSRPLIEESLQVLSFLNLNPISSTGLMNRAYGMCSAVFVIFTFIDVSLYLNVGYQDIDSTIFQVLIVIAFTQTTIKMVFILANQKELKLLISNTSMFWKPNIYEKEQQEENEKIYSLVKVCVRFYTLLLFVIVLFYFTKPLFHNIELHELPWGSCLSKFLDYKVCYMIQIIKTPFLVSTSVAFDTLYISLITNIICEFKFVENRFPNLKINPTVRGTDKEAMDELIILINHHNLILGCIKIMKHVYRSPMLGLFFSNMFGMCFALIVMTSSTSNKAIKLLFGIVTIFYLVQLFFYCICGSMLADESNKISAQVYKSKWWIKTQPELRKALIMVIRRSNEPETLTAGGLFQVNLDTFRMILRSTASFFTFIQVMYGSH